MTIKLGWGWSRLHFVMSRLTANASRQKIGCGFVMSNPAIARVLAVLLLLPTLIGSVDVRAQSFDITGVWRDENANPDDATTPQKEALPGQDELRNNFHGTYQSKPYLLITRQDRKKPEGPFFLYSDVGDLRAELQPSAGKLNDYDIVDRRSRKNLGVLRINAAECNGRSACFTFVAPASNLAVPVVRNNLPVLYIPVGTYDPTLDPKLDQTYGNMFSPISANFSYILKCWHLAHMNPVDYQVPGCGKNVFTVPSTDAYGYNKVGFANWHDAAMPFAWTYVSTLFQNGEERGHTWENGQDVAEADTLKVGVKASVNVFGVEASTHVSVGTESKIENMYNSHLTYSKAEYLSTQFAIVLHKFYARLDPTFLDRVQIIRALPEEKRSQEYDRFVTDFGTHYANAITFGSKGERVLRMNQTQVLAMHEGKVDVSVGLTAGYAGNTASVDVDTSKSNMEKITNNTSKEDRDWHCYSGGTCNDGIPSGDAVLPVQLDLRPISDLLAPPFFVDDDTITTVRDGLSRAIAKQAFVKRQDLNAPTAVFATVTGLKRYNITSISIKNDFPHVEAEDHACGTTSACRDGAVTLTSQDGSTIKMLGSSVPQPVTWRIPAKLNPNQYPGNPAPGLVTANFTWSGKCLNTASTWTSSESAFVQVNVPGLTVVPGNVSGITVVSSPITVVSSPNCVTSDNRSGVVTVLWASVITEVVTARSLLEK